jgi:hypothetical protein
LVSAVSSTTFSLVPAGTLMPASASVAWLSYIDRVLKGAIIVSSFAACAGPAA